MKKLKIKLLTTLLSLFVFENANAQNNVLSGLGGGLVGIGTLAPASVLHVDGTPYLMGNVFQTDCPAGLTTNWRMLRGGTQYGRLFNINNNTDFNIEATRQDLIIHARGGLGNSGTNVPALAQRIRVTSDLGIGYLQTNLNNVTKTVIERGGAIGNMRWPRAMLNIGTDAVINFQNQGGWRSWMDVGTFNIFGTDNMYTGLKEELLVGQPWWGDRYDAVVSWGDNDALQAGGCCGPDNLRFIYTTTLGLDGSNEAVQDGIEIARMTPDGFMGIGNFTQLAAGGGSGFQPARRLEIYDQSFNTWHTPTPAPQLRLTFTPAIPPGITTTGAWTDFQTMNFNTFNNGIGDLYIHPRGFDGSNVAMDRFVGINQPAPGNTLEINSGITTPTAGRKPAGLRFTNLNQSSSTDPANNIKFLTVDVLGDVVLDDLPPSGGSPSICTGGLTATYYITKITAANEICRTENIYEVGNPLVPNFGYVGIKTTGPNSLLDVNGDIDVFQDHQYKIGNLHALSMPVSGSNICVGQAAGQVMTTGASSNTMVGAFAGFKTTIGESNTAVGTNALHENTTGLYNVAVGKDVLYTNVNGERNIAIGTSACYKNVGGHDNIGIGYAALYENIGNTTTGNNNTAVGNHALTKNTTGNRNTAHGFEALLNNLNGDDNAAFGNDALQSNTAGINNTALGNYALSNNVSGNNNTAVGEDAGNDGNGINSDCTFLGHDADEAATANLSNATAIGSLARVTCNNCMVLGKVDPTGPSQVRVGIGYYNPLTQAPTTDPFLLYVNSIPCSACIPPATANNSAFFNGNIFVVGSGYIPSDSSLKDSIMPMPLNAASNILASLETKTFVFNLLNNPQLNLPSGLQHGLMAQDVELLLPGLVSTVTAPAILDTTGNVVYPELTFKGINYTGLVPLLVQAVNEQKATIDSLIIQMAACCLLSPRTTGSTTPNNLSIELKSDEAILYQNQPNPFDNSTVIRYFIPENTGTVKIVFNDNTGKSINEIVISEKLQGSLQVNAELLSSGIYTYSLMIDGKVIDSKKMVKAK